MKIVGVVNDYNEALDIEDIVKIFIIKQRIFNLLSLEKKKNFEKDNSNTTVFSIDDVEYAETSNKKIFHEKIDDEPRPIFNVRGLI